jgi:uncharacterized membrane protein
MMGTKANAKASRYWEVDTMRGLAVVLMVFYHLTWDLNYFGALEFNMFSGPWQWFARSIGSMFIWLVGVSLVLSYARTSQTGLFHKYLGRGSRIFGLGLLISLATYLGLDQGFVVFGILHLIGFTIIAAYPLIPYRRRRVSLVVGGVFIGLGIHLNRQVSPNPWLIWLGIKQAGRLMVDYYPVVPWFGLALLGIYAGHALYPGGTAPFQLARPVRRFCGTGVIFPEAAFLAYLPGSPADSAEPDDSARDRGYVT